MKTIFLLSVFTILLTACVSAKTQVIYEGQEYAVSRTALEKMTDFSIEREIIKNINQITGIEDGNHRIGVNSFRGDVLLTGEVPNDSIKTELERIIKSIRQVDSVYNYLVVGEPKGQSHTLQEQYLKTKIDAKLLLKQKENITPSQYLVVVRDDMAYIMGVMTKAQQEEIVQTAYTVDGLKGVSLVNSLVQFNFDGTSINSSNMAGNLNQINPNNRLIPLPTQNLPQKTQTPATNQAHNAQNTDITPNTNSVQNNIQNDLQNSTLPSSEQAPLSTNIAVFPNQRDNVKTPTTQNSSVEQATVNPSTETTNTATNHTTNVAQSNTKNETQGDTQNNTQAGKNSTPNPSRATTPSNVPVIHPTSQADTQNSTVATNGISHTFYGVTPSATQTPQTTGGYVDLYKNSTTP